MDLWDFITPEEMDELPEDRQAAFIQLVRIAEPKLSARLNSLGEREETNWERVDEAKYGFQNIILAAARKFQIQPFADIEMPTLMEHSTENYRQFRADLTHYITQIMLTAAERNRAGSIPLLEEARQSILTNVHHLRKAIDNTDLPEAKQRNLHKRLDEFEQELTRGRVRLAIIVPIVMAILAAPGDLSSSYDAVVKMTNMILRELGQAKDAEDQHRKIEQGEPVALLPPRKPLEQDDGVPTRFNRDEMDDEIPF